MFVWQTTSTYLDASPKPNEHISTETNTTEAYRNQFGRCPTAQRAQPSRNVSHNESEYNFSLHELSWDGIVSDKI